MKTHHPKLKSTPRPLFSCSFFRQCTQTALSPTTSTPPPLPLSNSDAPPPPPQQESPPTQQPPSQPESSSSSSSNTSQSFTQWRFPLPISPVSHHLHSQPQGDTEPVPLKGSTLDKTIRNAQNSARPPPPPPLPLSNDKLEELFHVAELQFSTGSNPDRVKAIYTLERSLVPNPRATVEGGDTVACPTAVMTGVLACLKERVAPKPASKVLLALCLAEVNRSVAVNAGAVGVVVEALADFENSVAERALAALELLCTLEEGAVEVRTHALAVPMMVQVMGKMEGRAKEYAISVLAVIYGGADEGDGLAPPEEVARAVMLALHGDCSARGRRKGTQLLKTLQNNERLELTEGER
ncbi:ARM repeat superfamily protein [Abeliophyllum distichum]|uniref:ARM repeat superfamily protein n=1 Tax=Abeliophyllum distichum TaxID=126358 RepID=A0ABD1UKH5_9LAMI